MGLKRRDLNYEVKTIKNQKRNSSSIVSIADLPNVVFADDHAEHWSPSEFPAFPQKFQITLKHKKKTKFSSKKKKT